MGELVKFKNTYAAEKHGLQSDWELIEAIAADAIANGLELTGAATVAAAKEASDAAGNTRAAQTITKLCNVAKFDHESTKAQRTVWRRYGWSVIDEVVHAGRSQEAAFELLTGSQKSFRQVREAVKPSNAGARINKSNDPELWDDDDWDAFDAGVVKSAAQLIRAFNLRQRGLYEPSVEATVSLALLREPDPDAELRALVGED